MSKEFRKNIEPVFEEWLNQEFPIVKPDGDYLNRLRLAFYTGAWVMWGLIQRSDKLPDKSAIDFLRDCKEEIESVIKPGPINGAIKKLG